LVVGGCWTEDRVGGVFSQDQLDRLRVELAAPAAPHPCTNLPVTVSARDCELAQRFGQALFFDSKLSKTGTISCASCHAPDYWFADNQPRSQGVAKLTGRNTISVVNVGLKPHGTFTWSGVASAADVITKIALPTPMGMTACDVARVIADNPDYAAAYRAVFGALVPPATSCDANDYEPMQQNVALALETYMRKLISLTSPFDRFIAGDDTAMTEQQLRGFGVFAGKGLCMECHRGPLFTDQGFHNTGVPSIVDSPDLGSDGERKFFTASLRDVAKTSPYMHDGSYGTLDEVIELYRWGGMANGSPKDRFMVPLDTFTDDDKHDLIAFLGALSGPPIAPELARTIAVAPPMQTTCSAMDGNAGLVCNGTCTSIVTDENNCGACGRICGDAEVCMGDCYPLNCMAPTVGCDHACVDVGSDDTNCGGCGNTCPAMTACMAGICQPLMCMPPAMACSNDCVDVLTDPAHCGGCSTVCPSNKPTCVAGTCKA
jgi:cytochrome c peroxidase